jgi:solute carrier family 13 (sodium-dependent dicarboxylate transporter), member 2/3/5
MTGSKINITGRIIAAPLGIITMITVFKMTDWPREQGIMAGIMVMAALLWVTEALPLFVTSLVVIAAEVILLANPGGWGGLGFEVAAEPTFKTILNASVSPILVLFFAGLVMSRAAVNEKVDQNMASWLLRPYVGSRKLLLFGVIGVTALFSMWMSNTSTTAFMLTLTMPLLAQINPSDPYRKGLLLAVPFAANIGGLGTPIASPPNAIALGYLRSADINVTFASWMMVAVPLMIVLLGVLGWFLLKLYGRSGQEGTGFTLPVSSLGKRAKWVVGVFVFTATLWLTEGVHGLPASVVSLVPVVALLVGGFVSQKDINRLEWDVLILIAGGLALGYGLSVTGLDSRIVAILPSGAVGMGLIATLVIATFVLSTLISNSAVANLILPIGLAAAYGQPGVLAVMLPIALAASLAMGLPVSTPPNAMAYARGELAVSDMAKAGIPIGLFGISVILLGAMVYMWIL